MTATRTVGPPVDPRITLRDNVAATGKAPSLCEVLMWPVIVENADDTGRYTFATVDLAAEAGVHYDTARSGLIRLRDRGLIDFKPRMGPRVRQTVTVKHFSVAKPTRPRPPSAEEPPNDLDPAEVAVLAVLAADADGHKRMVFAASYIARKAGVHPAAARSALEGLNRRGLIDHEPSTPSGDYQTVTMNWRAIWAWRSAPKDAIRESQENRAADQAEARRTRRG